MDVDIAEAREIKHPLGNNSAIGDDNNGVRSDGLKIGAKLRVVLDALMLENRKAKASGELLDGWNLKLLLAASRAVRLGKNQSDFVAASTKACKLGTANSGVPQKTSFKAHLALSGFTIRRASEAS